MSGSCPQVDSFATANVKHFLLPQYQKLGGGGSLEFQVLVSPAGGEPVANRPGSFSDGVKTWWHIRRPKPDGTDPHLIFPIIDHATHFGLSGWSYRDKRSYWAFYDFDSLVGHAAGVGVDDEKLAAIREKLEAIPWVYLVRSTGGAGFHLYALLPGVSTETREEHAALCRALLSALSLECDFNFAADVDALGHIGWVWSRTQAPDAYTVLKDGRPLLDSEVPANWRDHLCVVKRQRQKIKLHGVPDSDEEVFDMLASSHVAVPLDTDHRKIIDQLKTTGATTNWVSDYWLCQCHTVALDRVFKALGLKGFYATTSQGKDLGQPNCYMFPRPHGAWRVYRFGRNVSEAGSWFVSADGNTFCDYNAEPDLKVACRALGGVEVPQKGGFEFATAKAAIETCKALGQDVSVPETLMDRKTTLIGNRDGRLVVSIAKEANDTPLSGWLDQKKQFARVFDKALPGAQSDDRDWDKLVRSLETPQGKEAGWGVRRKNGKWKFSKKGDAKSYLMAQQMSAQEAEAILGGIYANSWTKVNVPFAPEFPGSRQWNIDSVQLRYAPSATPGEHPHWDRVLGHVGRGIDSALEANAWARQHNVLTGRQYLLMWIASAIRFPFEPLPYLALVGGEQCGKSILHESIAELMTPPGVVKADVAIASKDNFNGELQSAIIATIEESNLGANDKIQARVKDWTTSRTISIRSLHMNRFDQPNTLHFIQTTNHVSHVPVWASDTRVTLVAVPPVENEIPKPVLLEELRKEAPQFLRSLYDVIIPPSDGRLRIPVVVTEAKRDAIDDVEPVAKFLRERCILDKDARAGKQAMWEEWESFASEHGIAPESSRWLCRHLKSASNDRIGNKGKAPDENNPGKRLDAYTGVRLKSAELKDAA